MLNSLLSSLPLVAVRKLRLLLAFCCTYAVLFKKPRQPNSLGTTLVTVVGKLAKQVEVRELLHIINLKEVCSTYSGIIYGNDGLVSLIYLLSSISYFPHFCFFLEQIGMISLPINSRYVSSLTF